MEKKVFDFSNKGFISETYFSDNCYFLNESEMRDFIRKIEQHNREIYRRKLKDFEKSQEIIEVFEPLKESDIEEDVLPLDEISEEYDISFYENLLKSCPSTIELPHYLPKRNHPNFSFLMNQLSAKILKEIVEIENFMVEENLSLEEKREFLEEIKEKKELLNYFILYRDKTDFTEALQEEMEKENTLLFLQSTSGNYYALQDEKRLEQEYYKSFLELLESIKKGTFKNLKVFTSNNKLKGLLEVKEFKTRIVFQRLERDVYVILSMFLKKVNRDSYYLEQLETRCNQFHNAYSSIKEKLNDENYLRENEEIALELKTKWGGGKYGNS